MICLWWRFFVFDQKFVQTAKAQNFLPIATFFCLVRYVVYTTLSLSFRSSRRRQRRDDLFSRSSRLALLRSAQNVSSFSRGKRWKDYILFLRAQKRKLLPPLLLVLLSSCDLSSFYNYLWIIFARAPWASSLLFFYCLLVVQTVESSSSGGVVFSRRSFLSLSLTRALFHHS
jgi:hypothetical protein